MPPRDPAFTQLLQAATRAFAKKQAQLVNRFDLARHPWFSWDQDTGLFLFKDERHEPQVRARFQFVGTLAPDEGTWLWAWQNRSLARPLTMDMLRVRAFGREHGLTQLVQPEWKASLEDGWQMTYLAVDVLGAEGGYLDPKALVWFVFKDVAWLS